MNNIYQDKGYESRGHYLRCVAEDYGVDLNTVYTLADLLGPDEDFDGLIAEVSDHAYMSSESR